MSGPSEPISLVHVSDTHLGSGESHGTVNPETGLNVRFEDFAKAFKSSVDFALKERCDVFLFSGDAYKNASPEPMYQKEFAGQLRRLSEANIKTFLLVGNHDQILRSAQSHSMSVFQSLAVPNVITIDEPKLLRVETAHGPFQLIGIPHITRHLLMTHEQYASYSASEIEKVMSSHLRAVLEDYYSELDPSVPTIVTAHMMVDRARAGAEQELMIGYSMTFPLDMFIDNRIDYVALGHVHAHQVLRPSGPAVVYAGSIERVNFSEENEDKGFLHVKLARNSTTFQFHSIAPRPFVTVDADIISAEDPTASLINQIGKKIVPGCVLRVRYRLKQEQVEALDERAIRTACAQAITVHLKPEIELPQRPQRMPELTESSALAPLSALDSYLTQVSPERKDTLMDRARKLVSEAEQDP